MSGGEAEARFKGVQAVVVAGCLGNWGYLDSGLGGRMDRGLGGGGRDRYGDRFNQWEDNVANIILGTETNSPLAYALRL